jgi:hypothetical protein
LPNPDPHVRALIVFLMAIVPGVEKRKFLQL